MSSTRGLCFLAAGLTALFAVPIESFAQQTRNGASKQRVYVGTYTDGQSKGIYRFDFDAASGEASGLTLVAEASNPSFLAFDPTRSYLYAVSEVETVKGVKGGGVTGFKVDKATGALTRLNSESTKGGGPCHLIVDAAGKNVLAANYGGGSVVVRPIGEGGTLKPASSFVQHKGSGPNPARQKEPHAHSVNLDAANRFVFVADLGLDKVLVYEFNPTIGVLTPNDPPAASTAPGSGPRHFAFRPDNTAAYAIDELDSTVTVFGYDKGRGTLSPVQKISTLPAGFSGTNYPADVHVHPNGKFVYGSNRGHDSIASFQVRSNGGLTPTGHQGQGVKNPRNFGIDLTGRFLLVANQDGDTVEVFRIDPESGTLKPTGNSIKSPKPVCLQFAPASN